MLQLLLPVLSLAILGADASAGGETLHAGGDISLGIDIVAAGKALSYSVIVDGAIWLQSGPVAMTAGGVTYTSGSDSKHQLVLSGTPTKKDGRDATFGAFEEVVAQWTHQPSGLVTMETSFRAYSTKPMLVFEQKFPSAIKGAATGSGHNSASTAFPCWVMDHRAALHAFAGENQGARNGPWGSDEFQGGTQGGAPLVLYKAAAGGGGALRSVVMSPLDNFMDATIASPVKGLFPADYTMQGNVSTSVRLSAAGVLASVTEIPAGYTHPTVLVGAHGGPTPALMAWGDVLLAKTGKARTNFANHPTDLSLTTLGYWTDNGAWYHYLCSECCGGGGAQNPCPCPQECATGQTMEHTMLQVKADWAAKKIPGNYFMFDSWWYPKAGDPGANSSKPWPIRDSNGMLTWTPEPQVFPDGTAYWLGMPTFLHARYLAPETPYRKIPALKALMICEETGGSPTPPTPSANFSCAGPGYCAHTGVYCAGGSRKDLGDSTDDLKTCEAGCSKDSTCNCASWASDHEGGSACRLYSGATTFEASSGGFSAYVKPSSVQEEGELAGGICLPQDPAVFKHMMEGVQNWRPFVYEQDWISDTFDKSKSLTNSTGTGDKWLTSMNDAAASLNMTIQYSMSFTPAILQSAKLQAVTQIRGSGDYAVGSNQWRVGLTSMYYWALGVVASKDTLWTTEHQPGCPKAGMYNCTEPNLAIQMINAVLSGGPVGPGDRLGMTDPVMALRSCDTNGRLLRGDRPHAPLDLAFSHAVENKAQPLTVWSTYTDHSSRYHYIFNTDAASVYPKDLLLAEHNTTQEYLALTIAETPADGKTWGATASTLHTVSATSPLVLAPTLASGKLHSQAASYTPFSYTLLAPIGTGQDDTVVMLGELGKVVPASSHRFKQTAANEWTLLGGDSEAVTVSFAAKSAVGQSLAEAVKTVTCTLSAGGEGKLSCAKDACVC